MKKLSEASQTLLIIRRKLQGGRNSGSLTVPDNEQTSGNWTESGISSKKPQSVNADCPLGALYCGIVSGIKSSRIFHKPIDGFWDSQTPLRSLRSELCLEHRIG